MERNSSDTKENRAILAYFEEQNASAQTKNGLAEPSHEERNAGLVFLFAEEKHHSHRSDTGDSKKEDRPKGGGRMEGGEVGLEG